MASIACVSFFPNDIHFQRLISWLNAITLPVAELIYIQSVLMKAAVVVVEFDESKLCQSSFDCHLISCPN